MSTREHDVELRLEIPRALADVLDAISLARRISRNQLVLGVITDLAERSVHEASLVAKVAGINPPAAEGGGWRVR